MEKRRELWALVLVEAPKGRITGSNVPQ